MDGKDRAAAAFFCLEGNTEVATGEPGICSELHSQLLGDGATHAGKASGPLLAISLRHTVMGQFGAEKIEDLHRQVAKLDNAPDVHALARCLA